MTDQELLSALSTLIDEKLDQKLEENNKKLDHLEYQIKQTEYNLRNEIRRTEKLLLNEIERVHIILDQHINDPRMHPCLA